MRSIYLPSSFLNAISISTHHNSDPYQKGHNSDPIQISEQINKDIHLKLAQEIQANIISTVYSLLAVSVYRDSPSEPEVSTCMLCVICVYYIHSIMLFIVYARYNARVCILLRCIYPYIYILLVYSYNTIHILYPCIECNARDQGGTRYVSTIHLFTTMLR